MIAFRDVHSNGVWPNWGRQMSSVAKGTGGARLVRFIEQVGQKTNPANVPPKPVEISESLYCEFLARTIGKIIAEDREM